MPALSDDRVWFVAERFEQLRDLLFEFGYVLDPRPIGAWLLPRRVQLSRPLSRHRPALGLRPDSAPRDALPPASARPRFGASSAWRTDQPSRRFARIRKVDRRGRPKRHAMPDLDHEPADVTAIVARVELPGAVRGVGRSPWTRPTVATVGASGIVELLAQHGELASHCLDHRFVHARMNVR